jgi:hypothetical protein
VPAKVETRKANVMVVKNKDKVLKGGISFIGFVISSRRDDRGDDAYRMRLNKLREASTPRIYTLV